MKLVICIIIERELDALLLVEQTPGRGYWFPFDEVKPDVMICYHAYQVYKHIIYSREQNP